MLDAKFVRNNPEVVVAALQKRGARVSLDHFLALDQGWRATLAQSEQLKNRRNSVSEEIARLKSAGRDASLLISEMKDVSGQIKEHGRQPADPGDGDGTRTAEHTQRTARNGTGGQQRS